MRIPCLNGGVCESLPFADEAACTCQPGYGGNACQCKSFSILYFSTLISVNVLSVFYVHV